MKNGLLLVVFGLSFVAKSAAADVYASGLQVERMRLHGTGATAQVFFGTSSQPGKTCSNYGDYFAFETTTEAGKQQLSILLAAKLSGKPIQLWYSESTDDQNSDCNDSTISRITGIALQ